LLCLWATAAHSDASAPDDGRSLEIDLGLSLGVSIPGDQDLKLIRHDGAGDVTDFLFTEDVDEQVGPLITGYVALWGWSGIWEYLGLELDASYWRTSARATLFVDQLEVPPRVVRPPFSRFDQDRFGLFGTFLGRLPLGRRTRPLRQMPVAFLGVGIGTVYTNVQHGYSGWGTGFQVLAGASAPISEHLRARLDFRFLMAPDADVGPESTWNVHVSGTPYPGHLAVYDTRFFAVSLGLEWGL